MDNSLTQAQARRYSRQLLLSQVGLQGQLKLQMARVLIIGTGGLGSPAGLYLASAGVGTIGLVDLDEVDVSNLHRQVLYTDDDIGKRKTAQAAKTLLQHNPDCQIIQHDGGLTEENASPLIADYDVILDCTDNFITRYLINDTCVLLKKPYIYASIFQFDGQLTVLASTDGPCYRCMYPTPPQPGEVPNCSEAGVLPTLPGMLGVAQANEAIKQILGVGELPIGQLLFYDALESDWQKLQVKKNPECPICGSSPTITEVKAIQFACETDVATEFDISANDARQMLDGNAIIVDIREPHEYLTGEIRQAQKYPGKTLLDELDSLTHQTIIITCQSGKRSKALAEALHNMDFKDAYSLAGGVQAWLKAGFK